jgi:hypothetical protein
MALARMRALIKNAPQINHPTRIFSSAISGRVSKIRAKRMPTKKYCAINIRKRMRHTLIK